MAKVTTKATKATKGNKASKPAAIATSNPNPRAKRPGVVAIEAAGGSAASLSIVSPPRMVVGGDDTSKAETCLALLRKARTVGEYLAARDKAGMGATLGGYLPGWVEKGYVAVGKGKGKPAKAKVEA